MIFHYWKTEGPILADQKCFQRITKCDNRNVKKLYARVSAFFTIENGYLRHKRIDEELAKATEMKQKRSSQTEAARAALAARKASVTETETDTATEAVTDRYTRADLPSPSPDKERNPPYPQAVDNSKEDLSKIGKGMKFDVGRHLTDTGLAKAKQKAPGWDVYYLAAQYNDAVFQGILKPPREPDKAFPAWCASFTKGKPPQ